MAQFDNDATAFTAFISYSHSDSRAASRLLKRLQIYRLPIEAPENGRRRLGPFFMDRETLAAADSLSDAILQGIARSNCMIVLCSKAAVDSEWVNREIRTFRQVNPTAAIIPVILNLPNTADEAATALFPEQLLRAGREPLAADFRKSGDGSKLGFLKLVSALSNVPLSRLLQKDTKRRNRRVTAITMASAILSTVMLSLAMQANVARQNADERREEVEGMVDFMLNDLKSQLEPVGRLEVLRGVSAEVIDYYSKQDDSKLDCEAIVRKSSAFHLAVSIHNHRSELDEAAEAAAQAINLIAGKKAECSADPEFMVADGHSEYWAASPLWQQVVNLQSVQGQNSEEAKRLLQDLLPYYNRYESAISPLKNLPNWKLTYAHERADVATNLASVYYRLAEFKTAALHIESAIEAINEVVLIEGELRLESERLEKFKAEFSTLANLYGWEAGIRERIEEYPEAFALRKREFEIMDALASAVSGQTDYPSRFQALQSEHVMLRIRAKLDPKNLQVKEFLDLEDRVSSLIQVDPTNETWKDILSRIRAQREAFELTKERGSSKIAP